MTTGDLARIRVSAVSTFDNAQTAFNDDQVTVTGNAVMNVTKAISQARNSGVQASCSGRVGACAAVMTPAGSRPLRP